MAAQQGFQYEANVVKFLAPHGLCLNETAGASSDKPDLTLKKGKKTAGCELKITAASAGSLVLKHEQGKWRFNDTSNDPEKDFLKSIANDVKLFNRIKKEWTELPLKRSPPPPTAAIGKMTKEQIYKRDLSVFPDLKGEVPASIIAAYYNKKKTHYVNVGTHGFFLFGSADPLGYNAALRKRGMPEIPDFGAKATAIYRARVQYKGSGNYQFTFEIQFSIKSANKSPYNIGCVDGKSVTIIKKDSDFSCLI